MSRPWIKQPVNKLNDARLSFVSVQAQRDYFMLYLLAGQLDIDGLFFENGRRLQDKEIAFRIHTDLAQYKKSIKELQTEGLIHVNGKGPMITDWGNEQINWKEKQEQTRERVTRYRERVTRNVDSVTRNENDVTLPDQKKTRRRPDVDKKKTRPDHKAAKSSTSPSSSGRQAGAKKSDDSESAVDQSFKSLKGKQRKRAQQAMTILSSLGIRNPKLEETSAKVAIRIYKNDEQMINEMMAVIASVYSDTSVNSKEAVIIHRLEAGKIPQSFIEDRKLWRSIPVKTIELVGINPDQLDTYKYKLDQLRYGTN